MTTTGSPTPAGPTPSSPSPVGPTPPRVPTPGALRSPAAAPASDATRFGRVEADGTVILLAPEGEVVVGQWAAGEPSAGLAFFARKYDDLVVEIDLIERRLREHRAPADQAQAVLDRVREALVARSFVGDVAALETRCATLEGLIGEERERAAARKAEQRERAMARRAELATEAEALADSTNWRGTSERYAAIVDEWKALPRADRGAEQELWSRISTSRTAFDKRRRAHFTEVESNRKSAISVKRDLIARAEALSVSTDWVATSRKLRDLMTEWKAAPRASRTDEDKLWKRFKGAQDAFYAARVAAEDAEQETLKVNVPAKEALVVEAEALVPVTDLKAAKAALRGIQDRWEKAGDLPKADRDRLERRLHAVEDAVRKQESDAWEKSAGTGGSNAFEQALSRLEDKHAAAVAKGDTATASALEAQIASTKALLGR